MAVILQTPFSIVFLLMKMFVSWFKFCKIIPKVLIDNVLTLVQVMAWACTGDKPLPEPMMTQCTDAYLYVSSGPFY